MRLRPILCALTGLWLISVASPACSTRPAIPTDKAAIPPAPDIPPHLLSAEPEAFPFEARPGRSLVEMETEVVRPLAQDRLRLVRDRATVRCILEAWRRDPWADHGCEVDQDGGGG